MREALLLVGRALLGLVVRRGDDVLRAGGRRVAVLEDQQHRVVVVEQGALHPGEQAVVPEAAVTHDRQRAALHHRRDAGAAGQAHAVAQDGMPDGEGLEGAEGVAADVGRDVHRPTSCCASLSAENTGRSGQPMQKLGGRVGSGALELPRRLRGACALPSSQRLRVGDRCSRQVALRRTASSAAAITSTVYSPAAGSRSLPCSGVWMSRRRSRVRDAPARCIRAGLPRRTSTARLPAQKSDHLLGHQRVGHVEHQHRDVDGAERIGQAQLLQRADQRVVQAALHDQAEVLVRAGAEFVEPVLHDVAPRGRNALLALELFVAERHRRMREPHVVEARRLFHQCPRRQLAAPRCPCTRSCRARGRRGCAVPGWPACSTLRTGESRARPCATMSPRSGRGSSSSIVRLQRIGVGALLDHAGAFAVVLADHDQRAALDAGRRKVRQRVGRRRWCRRWTSRSPRRAAGSGSRRPASRRPRLRWRRPRRARPARPCRAWPGPSRRAGATPARPGSRRRRPRPIAAGPW